MAATFEKVARVAMHSLIPNRPYHVQWMITRKCNYRCRGCNVWREQDTDELSTEEIKKGLDVLKELGVLEIVFSGGNPLLRNDIGEILNYASKSFVTTVYDNGSLAVEKIDKLQDVDFVAISLDTMKPETGDYLKGVRGSWQKGLEAIQKLTEKGISVGVSPTISQLNLHEIVDLTGYFAERGVPVWYCLYSYDTPPDLNQVFNIGRRRDEFEIKDSETMCQVCDSIVEMKRKNSNILITNKILEAVKRLFLDGKRLWKCQALRNFFVIDHLGRVAGCHLRSPVTSVFKLNEVWNSSRFDELRSQYTKCSGCIYLCYIFYSLHGGVIGNFQIAQERWRNAKLLLKRRSA